MYNMIVSHIRIEYIQFVHVWARAHYVNWLLDLQPPAQGLTAYHPCEVALL